MHTSIRNLSLLKQVLELPTAPYNEDRVASFIRSFARRRKLDLQEDEFGNMLLRLDTGGSPLGLIAHMDHPGFEIAGRVGNRLIARFHGSVAAPLFQGAGVVVYDGKKKIPGTVLDIETSQENSDVPRVIRATIRIDDKIKQVNPGSLGMWDLPPFRNDGRLICGRALDDLGGVALILSVFAECRRKRLEVDLWGVFTRAEEAGLIGCIGLCEKRFLPDMLPVFAIEASYFHPYADIGKGPVIRVGDKQAPLDPGLTWFLIQVARDLRNNGEDFDYQKELLDAGTCEGTILNAFGYRAGGLSLPLDNYHNVNRKRIKLEEEKIHLDDFTRGIRLMTEAARRASEITEIGPTRRSAFNAKAEKGLARLRDGRWSENL